MEVNEKIDWKGIFNSGRVQKICSTTNLKLWDRYYHFTPPPLKFPHYEENQLWLDLNTVLTLSPIMSHLSYNQCASYKEEKLY